MCRYEGEGRKFVFLHTKIVFDAVWQKALVSFPIYPWYRWQISYRRPSGRDHYGKSLVFPTWNQTSIIHFLTRLWLLNYTAK